jgi:hypothetical protein
MNISFSTLLNSRFDLLGTRRGSYEDRQLGLERTLVVPISSRETGETSASAAIFSGRSEQPRRQRNPGRRRRCAQASFAARRT